LGVFTDCKALFFSVFRVCLKPAGVDVLYRQKHRILCNGLHGVFTGWFFTGLVAWAFKKWIMRPLLAINKQKKNQNFFCREAKSLIFAVP